MPICVDRDIPEAITSAISRDAGFKICGRAQDGMEDRTVWRQAIKLEAVLLTHDEHFWDDRRYPLRESPGVIVVKGASEREVGGALTELLGTLPFKGFERAVPGAFWRTKIKASVEGFVLRYIDVAGNPSRIQIEYVQQRGSIDELLEPFVEAVTV